MNVLTPARYPPTDANERAIRHGIDLVEGHRNPEPFDFHTNEVQGDHRTSRRSLCDAVESVFDGIDTSYVARGGFLLEEAIRLDMEHVLLGEHRRDRWKQLLEAVLGGDQNPERLTRDDTGVEVVTDTGREYA